MITAIIIIAALVAAVYLFMKQPKFGALPSGERLERIKRSAHYRNGAFQNIHPTEVMAEGVSLFTVMKEFFFHKSDRLQPAQRIPSRKTDLHGLAIEENVLVWFGHSSYFMQVDGKRFLVDPVFSGSASPFSFVTKSYEGANVYDAADFPAIDYLVITHDHWDHLDYGTVMKLKPKIKTVVTGLGTAAHFERWGFAKQMILEKDWQDNTALENGFSMQVLPARHFSGRTFKRNQSIWISLVLQTPSKKIYLGGDSGYDTHFTEIGETYGPFDLAILECGQYNKNWPHIHQLPEETVQASIDLRAKYLLPVHWGKFSLAQHAWDEPIIRATAEAARKGVLIVHPMIGEPLDLEQPSAGSRWWEDAAG